MQWKVKKIVSWKSFLRWTSEVWGRVGYAVFAYKIYSFRSELKRIWILFALYSLVILYFLLISFNCLIRWNSLQNLCLKWINKVFAPVCIFRFRIFALKRNDKLFASVRFFVSIIRCEVEFSQKQIISPKRNLQKLNRKIAHYLLSAAHGLLPTVHFPLFTSHCLPPTVYSPLLLLVFLPAPTFCCPLPTANCLLPIAHCLLPTVSCPLSSVYCLLSIVTVYFPLPFSCTQGTCVHWVQFKIIFDKRSPCQKLREPKMQGRQYAHCTLDCSQGKMDTVQ
jgi:hypothetical protein